MEDEKIRLSQKEVKTFNALKAIGGVHFPVFKDNTNYYKLPLSEIEENVDNKISSATQNLQTELTFDTTPTAGSSNPVFSAGIKAALNSKQDVFTIINADSSTTEGTVTVSIEQGDFYKVDLSEETSITAIEIELTNNASVAFPCWWFKIKAGSDITLSVAIGAVAVGWLGSEITNIELGKTVEISVVDGIACGGELV
jgi:hypothetical protein